MIRKSLFALAAVAALALTAVSATDASAKGGKGMGWHKGGHHHFHHGHGFRRGLHFGFYAPAYIGPDCWKVVTPRGRIKTVCTY